MTLAQIRTATDLIPAIHFLSDNMDEMTFGEFHAFKRTIEVRAVDLNIAISTIDEIATQYQVFGY